MKDESKALDLIDRLLNNQLSEEDRLKIKDLMQKDEVFASLLTHNIAAKRAFENERKKEIFDIIDANNPSFYKHRFFIWSAAIIALLVMLFLVFKYLYPNPILLPSESRQILYAFQEEVRKEYVVAGNNEETDWVKAVLNNENNRALKILNKQLAQIQTPCDRPDLSYNAGMLLLYQKEQYAKAEELLKCGLGTDQVSSYKPSIPLHIVVAMVGQLKKDIAIKFMADNNLKFSELPNSIREILEDYSN